MTQLQVRTNEKTGKIIDYLVTKKIEELEEGKVTKIDIVEEAIQNFYKDIEKGIDLSKKCPKNIEFKNLKYKEHTKLNIDIRNKIYKMFFEMKKDLKMSNVKLLDIIMKAEYVKSLELKSEDGALSQDKNTSTIKIPLEFYYKLLSDSKKLKMIQNILNDED